MKIYGNHIASYLWCDKETSVFNRTLEIYQTKTFYKGLLWNSGFLHWKTNHKPMKELKGKTIDELLASFEVPNNAYVKQFCHN